VVHGLDLLAVHAQDAEPVLEGAQAHLGQVCLLERLVGPPCLEDLRREIIEHRVVRERCGVRWLRRRRAFRGERERGGRRCGSRALLRGLGSVVRGAGC